MVDADWSGHSAVGQTAFWLKVVSEPRIVQLKSCKTMFVQRVVQHLAGADLFSDWCSSGTAGAGGKVGGSGYVAMLDVRALYFALVIFHPH